MEIWIRDLWIYLRNWRTGVQVGKSKKKLTKSKNKIGGKQHKQKKIIEKHKGPVTLPDEKPIEISNSEGEVSGQGAD